MNKSLTILALGALSHLDKPVPVDITAKAEGYGFYGAGAVRALPIHPQTAAAVNYYHPDTFDDDDIAVFQTTFYSHNH